MCMGARHRRLGSCGVHKPHGSFDVPHHVSSINYHNIVVLPVFVPDDIS